MIYIMMGFSAGILSVLSMTICKKIVEKIGTLNNIIITYLAAAIILFVICLFRNEFGSILVKLKPVPLIYFTGGFIGLLIMHILNVLIFKISVVYIVILRFIGQMIAGATLDYFFLDILSIGKIIGALLFITGLILNARVEKRIIAEKI